jgi:hypothetical protein
MKKKTQAPKYDVDEQVWLRESAVIGHLEPYRVANIVLDREHGNWLYQLNVLDDRPLNTFNAAENRNSVYVEEFDLLTYCEAIDLVRSQVTAELNKLYQLKSKCSGTE